jgi:hypothetical protein
VTVVSWLTEPEEHDYPAAGDYLGLIAGPRLVAVLVEELRRTQNVHRKAKDILRASGLPLLPTDNPHVASDLKKIRVWLFWSDVGERVLMRPVPRTGRAAWH